ncbi:Mitochondrial carrier protein ymc2 [Tulasnella sp. 427]|nr:Mitochondrial carrier protein ymc2 [Tulasnella sp. 427]
MSRKSTRTVKVVQYTGLDVEEEIIELETRPSKKRKTNGKPAIGDEDFTVISSDDDIVEYAPPSKRTSNRTKPKEKKSKGKKRSLEDSEADDELTLTGVSVPHSKTLHNVGKIKPLMGGLLEWFDSVRDTRGMPWRKEYDPSLSDEEKAQRAYEVLVSEIMLQQTQVTTVIPYYNAWLERFPTIKDLAAVTDIEEVNALWKGLGYYRRAKALLEAAKKVVKNYDGRIPKDVAVMEKDVPGVGRYTAGAVCSIAYGVKAPAVDGNVQRLFARLLAIHAQPKKAALDLIWNAATKLVKTTDRPGDLNQAFIELGSTICKPQNPACGSCPLKDGCAAYRLANETRLTITLEEQVEDTLVDIEDMCNVCEPFPDNGRAVTRFPMKVIKKAQRREASVVTVLQVKSGGQEWVLMAQRPAKGLLAGLWEFPTTDLAEEEPGLPEQLKATRAVVKKAVPNADSKEVLPVVVGDFLHLFSHIRKTYIVLLVTLSLDSLPPAKDGAKWVKPDKVSSMNVGKSSEKVLVGQPFDIVKVRMQSSPPGTYSGMLSCAGGILKNEGPLAFYKGTLSPLLGIGVCVSIQFGAVESTKRWLAKRNVEAGRGGPDGKMLSGGQLVAAGVAAGLSNGVVSGPVEHIRIRLQIQGNENKIYNGPLDAVRKIYRNYGIAGIYKGQAITLCREAVGYGAYFWAYEKLVQRHMASHGIKREELSPGYAVLFGAAAGYALWACIYPIDVIKTRMQTDGFAGDSRKYKSTLDCVRKVWRNEGINGFSRGLIPTLIRSPFANGATFVFFELASRALADVDI